MNLHRIALFVAATLTVAASPLAAEQPRRPNFVFILVDDLGYMDVSPNSPATFYDTPNVKRLADSGMRFTNAYAACPVCSPTRASIMTGKYPVRTGVTDYFGAPGSAESAAWKRNTKLLPATYNPKLDLEETTIAEALRSGGYATFFAGKWHLGDEPYWPEHQGFDVNKGGIDRGGPYGGKKYFSPYGNPRLEDGPDGEHLPDRLASETVKFIETNREKPFFAYLSFYSVHTPLMGRPDLVVKYEAKAAKLEHGPLFGDEPPRQVRLVQEHAVYAAMVEAMDQAVGKVLDALDRLKLADNTVVIFFSDNGGLSTSEGSPTSNLPLRGGKGWMYEGGIREPCIVRAPGVTRANSISDVPIVSTDFFPTMLDLAGLALMPEEHIDGLPIASILRGKVRKNGTALEGIDRAGREDRREFLVVDTPFANRPIFWHYPHYGNQGGAPGGAVRRGDWKLIEWYEDGRVELFNLADDIGETKNLADAEPQRVAEMKKLLAEWREATGAKMPTVNPDYDPKKKDGRG